MIILVVVSLLICLVNYFSLLNGGGVIFPIGNLTWLILYTVLYVFYIAKYRRHNIICFETFFILISGVSFFFNLFVSPSNSDLILIDGMVTSSMANKALYINLIAILFFYIGSFVSEKKSKNAFRPSLENGTIIFIPNTVDFDKCTWISTLIALFYFVYILASGDVLKWFYYTSSSTYSNDDAWRMFKTIGYLLNVATVFNFFSLFNKGVDSFHSFLKHVNILFLALVLTVSILFVISGNRGEFFMVVLPIVALYPIVVKPIKATHLILFFLFGWFLMVYVGFTRQGDTFNYMAIDLANSMRDYAPAYSNTIFLIDYTDKNGTASLGDFVLSISSFVPYLGGFLKDLFDIQQSEFSMAITTEGILGSSPNSNLGTSLVGDLYYQGKTLFVIFFYFLLGYINSRIYYSFYIKQTKSLWVAIIYTVLVASSVYYPRAPWAYAIRFLGFELIIAFLISLLFRTTHKSSILRL